MHAKTVLGWCLVAFAAASLACTTSDDTKNPPVDGNGGSGGGEGGTGGIGGTGGTGEGGTGGGEPLPGPTVAELERLGHHTPGPARAVLSSINTNFDIVGHDAVEITPDSFGLDLPHEPGGSVVHGGGISVLDRTTGQVRFYDRTNGVPETHFLLFGTIDYGLATSPIWSMAWVVPDQVFAAAAWDWLIVGTVAADGSLTFESTRLRAPGLAANAMVTTVAVSNGEIFVGSDQGLAVVDPTTVTVTRWADLGPSLDSNPMVYKVAAGELLGSPTVVATIGNNEGPTHLAVIDANGTQNFYLESGELPTGLGTMSDVLLVGVREADGRGSIRGIFSDGTNRFMETLVDAGSLNTPENPRIIPAVFAWDEGRGQLIVGGDFVGDGPSQPIALVTVRFGRFTMVEDVIDSRDPYYWSMPWKVDAITVDALGRWYVAGKSLCSHIHARQLGLHRYEFGDDGLRLVRPWVSGVRTIATDPVEGHTWLGLRDAFPGLACFGADSQTGVCRLKADGSCELWNPQINTDAITYGSPSVTDLVFGDPAKKQLAMATIRNGAFVRAGDFTRALDTTLNPGVNLWLTSADLGEDGALWLGSISEWWEDPSGELDNDAIDSRTPHGVGYIPLAADGAPIESGYRRYSRLQAIDWNKDYDTPGLPSNTAWDVIALPGAQHALVACGIERWDRNSDFVFPEPSPKNISGGIAEIAGTDVFPFAPPAGVSFADVTALARGADGQLFALDATAGILRLDLETRTTTLFARAPWTAPEYGLALAVDASGRLAVGTTAGLYVFGADGGVTPVFTSGHGWVWRVAFLADGVLYAGADQGLFRVALDDATLPARGPSGPLARELWELPVCGGVEGCVCTDNIQCAPGLDCLCDAEWSCACGVYDPCAADPGALGCACEGAIQMATAPCQEGLSCVCNGPDCTCQAACGDAGCACTADTDCNAPLVCTLAGTCEDPAAYCDENCTCDTPTGCPEGETCQQWTDPEGNVVNYCDYPVECRQDCTCATESGCPDGMYCRRYEDGSGVCRPGI